MIASAGETACSNLDLATSESAGHGQNNATGLGQQRLETHQSGHSDAVQVALHVRNSTSGRHRLVYNTRHTAVVNGSTTAYKVEVINLLFLRRHITNEHIDCAVER